MDSSHDSEHSRQKTDQLLFGGLAGLCTAVLLQVIDKRPALDRYMGWGLYCFALALPMLVASFLLETNRPVRGDKTVPRLLFDLLGVLLAVAGFVLFFFYLDTVAGFLFLGCAIVCGVVVLRGLRQPSG